MSRRCAGVNKSKRSTSGTSSWACRTWNFVLIHFDLNSFVRSLHQIAFALPFSYQVARDYATDLEASYDKNLKYKKEMPVALPMTNMVAQMPWSLLLLLLLLLRSRIDFTRIHSASTGPAAPATISLTTTYCYDPVSIILQ